MFQSLPFLIGLDFSGSRVQTDVLDNFGQPMSYFKDSVIWIFSLFQSDAGIDEIKTGFFVWFYEHIYVTKETICTLPHATASCNFYTLLGLFSFASFLYSHAWTYRHKEMTNKHTINSYETILSDCTRSLQHICLNTL